MSGHKKGDKPRNQSGKQQETGNHDGTASFFEQSKKRQEGRQEGRQAQNQSRNQQETGNHDGTKTVSSKN